MAFIDVENDLCSNSAAPDREDHLLQKPSVPGRPMAQCDGGIYVTVEWTGPEDHGGSDVTGYVIKYGDKDTDVDNYAIMSIAGNTTNFQFTDQLKERTKYRFAVSAENRVAREEYSEFSDYVETQSGKQCHGRS